MSPFRALATVLALLALITGHTAVLTRIDGWPGVGAVLAPILVAVGWRYGIVAALGLGLGAGMTLDLMPPAAGALGASGVALALTGAAGAWLLRHEQRLWPAVSVAAGAAGLAAIASPLLGAVLGDPRSGLTFSTIPVVLILAAAVALVVLPAHRPARARVPMPVAGAAVFAVVGPGRLRALAGGRSAA